MSQCFSCGQDFTQNVNALLSAYKEQYEKLGIIRYFYKKETNGAIYICKASSFATIYESDIKPNFDKGAEYSHIKEYP
jgi:hypothetical protein